MLKLSSPSLPDSDPLSVASSTDRLPRLLIWAALAALLAAAMALRAPGFMVVPRLTDEILEVGVGLRIARGELLPLTNFDSYDGALFNYLVAGVFLLLGERLDAGRILVLVTGSLTLIPTYLLGRSLGGPGRRGQVVGLMGAALLAASATHTAVSSRLAYSHSLTPLFTTLGLWLLHRALVRGSGPLLVASGFAFGLALQTHPSALALWPGLGAVLLLRGRGLIVERRGRWIVLAGLAAMVAVWNLVVFNVTNDFASFKQAAARSEDYVQVGVSAGRGWPERMAVLLKSTALALGSQVSEAIEPWTIPEPLVVVMVGLVLLGLASLARRREWLPVLVIVSGLVAISYLNGRFEPIVGRARHYAPLLPLALVVVGEGLAVLHAFVVQRGIWRPAAHVAVGCGLLTLIAGSVSALWSYQARGQAHPISNNSALLAVVNAVAASGRRNERVYIDTRLGSLETFSGGRTSQHLRYAFDVAKQDSAFIDLARTELPFDRSRRRSWRLILRSDSVEAARGRYRLKRIRGEPGSAAPVRVFRAYPLSRSERGPARPVAGRPN
jgi:hypothetical protein